MSESLKIVGSNVAKLRALLCETSKNVHGIQLIVSTLCDSLQDFWNDSEALVADDGIWRETTSLLASGRVLSVCAQACEVLRTSTTNTASHLEPWVGNGTEFTKWIARGIIQICAKDVPKRFVFAAQLCGRTLSLGYNDTVVEVLIDQLAFIPSKLGQLRGLLVELLPSERKRFLISTLDLITKRYTPVTHFDIGGENVKVSAHEQSISSAAALLEFLILSSDTFAEDLCDWIISHPCPSNVARAVLAALPFPSIKRTMARTWLQFGDKLRVKHSPIFHQEYIVQLMLMTAGRVWRIAPSDLKIQARSPLHSNGISLHLGSSSPRVRLLGMMVGMAISKLVDQPANCLEFDNPELSTPEARWYLSLTSVQDSAGFLANLKPENSVQLQSSITTVAKPKKQKIASAPKRMIVEVAENEDDLPVLTKPDSDPEDEDEDPTLVQRKKRKPLVYVRELIAGLQNTEDYDYHLQALSTAASLIRRKATFGTEFTDRAEELATILTGLGDPFSMENWHDMRQEGMVATAVAAPKQLGMWYVQALFNGDYSTSQRASILVTIGLAARELMGMQNDAGIHTQPQFPSKLLPDRYHKIYAGTAQMDALARNLEQSMLRPTTTKTKTRTIRNQLPEVVARSFFFPLVGYWQSSSQSIQTSRISRDPFLLPLFLKTLSIITTAAGLSTVSLPQMTTEFWHILLSLRPQASDDSATMEAELFGLLTILNVNEDRRQLAIEHASELLETQEWVGMVYEKLSTTDEEGERCKVLAAGVLVAIKEVVDKYQRLMVGNLALT